MPKRSVQRNRRRPNEPHLITKLTKLVNPKNVLVAVGSLAILGLTAYYAVTSSQLIDFPTNAELIAPSQYNPFDCSSLENILNHEDRTVTPAERKSALRDNISMILYKNEMGGFTPTGSATRISQGGYFTTVAHTIDDAINNPNIKGVYIVQLSTNIFYFARYALLDSEHDAAIIYAPTGYPDFPIRGIEFRKDEVKEGEELELMGIRFYGAGNTAKYSVSTSRGRLADTSVLEKPFIIGGKEIYFTTKPDALIVKGARPSGGTSGGSFSDDKGRIVGVEQGAYGGIEVRDYEGATVTPVKPFDTLFKKCPVQRLP